MIILYMHAFVVNNMKKNIQQEDIGNKELELESMLNNKDDCTFKTSDHYGNHEKYQQQKRSTNDQMI